MKERRYFFYFFFLSIGAHGFVIFTPLSEKEEHRVKFTSNKSLSSIVVHWEKKREIKKYGLAKKRENNDKNGKNGVKKNAKALGSLNPRYPYRAKRMGKEGVTKISVKISKDGRIVEIKIIQTSGDSSLDNEALRTLREATFEPAIKNGVSIDSIEEFTFRFKLK